MVDLRERDPDLQETIRSSFEALNSERLFAATVMVNHDSDGKTTSLQPTIKRVDRDEEGTVTVTDPPLLEDVPIHYPGGGGVTTTHPVKKGDEGVAIFMDRHYDTWFQSSGVQKPISPRMNSMSDAILIPGIRSQPRELKNISTDSHQTRSDDGKHTIDHSPTGGTTIKSVGADDKAENPFKDAKKFHASSTTPEGVKHEATDNGKSHTSGVSHEAGAFMRALNGLHEMIAHPLEGAKMLAQNGLHKVIASAEGVLIKSAKKLIIDVPPEGLQLPAGGVSGAALSQGAASGNIGQLEGDLSGNLPTAIVIHVTKFTDFHLLPNVSTDAGAASAGVVIDGPYRDGSKLCFRVS